MKDMLLGEWGRRLYCLRSLALLSSKKGQDAKQDPPE
jgi:hypothetical protein